jgi:hypothetical protein
MITAFGSIMVLGDIYYSYCYIGNVHVINVPHDYVRNNFCLKYSAVVESGRRPSDIRALRSCHDSYIKDSEIQRCQYVKQKRGPMAGGVRPPSSIYSPLWSTPV